MKSRLAVGAQRHAAKGDLPWMAASAATTFEGAGQSNNNVIPAKAGDTGNDPPCVLKPDWVPTPAFAGAGSSSA
ncbi:MAG: hypothetical protein QM780_03255 [Hyphomicrobium sp.]|uniref:hypothetical protein n=1 Tax=Hyphomicrobium sp. TaxID=82 RepID=UPI0039E51A43